MTTQRSAFWHLMASGIRAGIFAFGTLVWAGIVQADTLSLGSMTLVKSKGQPTYAEIVISGATQGDIGRLRARVASPDAYRAAGLRYVPALSQITVSSRGLPDGRAGLRLDIPDAAADGSLDLLLLVGDAVSVAMAEYRLDFSGAARVFPALEAGTALIPTSPQVIPSKIAAAPPTPLRATSSPPSRAPAQSVAAAASVASTSNAPPASTDKAAAGQAAAALAAWADAWSRRDVDAYLARYASDFTGRTRPPSHEAWAAERRARIDGKHSIEVRVSSLSIVPKSGRMVLTFAQSYVGDGLKQNSRKRLTMRHEGDQWVIQEETELP